MQYGVLGFCQVFLMYQEVRRKGSMMRDVILFSDGMFHLSMELKKN